MVARLLTLLALLALCSCNDEHGEAYLPGQCTDEADNDGDGLVDCQESDCSGSPDCQPPAPLDACADNSPSEDCLIVAVLEGNPPQLRPGADFTLSIWIAHSEASNAVLEIDGQPTEVASLLVPSEGGLRAELTGTAQIPLGDQLISLHAQHSEGAIAGYTLMHVTRQDPCEDGQVREAGLCVEPHTGVALRPQSMFHTPYAGSITGGSGDTGERMMLHPRRVFAAEEALVTCLTDSVAVIDPDQMFPIDVDANPW